MLCLLLRLSHHQNIVQVDEHQKAFQSPFALKHFHEGHPDLGECAQTKTCCLELKEFVADLETKVRPQCVSHPKMKIGVLEVHLTSPHTLSHEGKNVVPMIEFEMGGAQKPVYFPTIADEFAFLSIPLGLSDYKPRDQQLHLVHPHPFYGTHVQIFGQDLLGSSSIGNVS